jgi:hypothetical protein
MRRVPSAIWVQWKKYSVASSALMMPVPRCSSNSLTVPLAGPING